MISSELQSVLHAAGWRPNRRVSVTYWIDTLRSHGFSIVPQAEVILEEFGGLEMKPKVGPSDKHAPGVVIIDPLKDGEFDRVSGWQKRLKMKLTPIGVFSGEACLLVAEDGSIYTSWDRFLWKRGDSLLDALENTLLFGHRSPVEVC
ncbi:MAG: SUKH-3 domain-containing protein [Planctomycetes bacterium]|nr:SUKH-3 domain-containing protein [Planctomycetota bacterium]